MRRMPAALFGVLLLLLPWLFGGCSGDSTGKTFRYDIAQPVQNLDPQFATDASARLILGNLFEGLVVCEPDGSIQPGVAESYTVSDDRLTYTFRLRETAAWEDETPVTADDFAFTFYRMFRDGSPHAEKYLAIEGARALLTGESELLPGVRAEAGVLTLTLEEADPLLLGHLADPAAAPCNESVFTESRGRYGLEIKHLNSNGPFMLSRWDETRLGLRKNEAYRSEKETVADGVVFYIGRETAAQFRDGQSDIATLDQEELDTVPASRMEVVPIQKTVWCIVFNQDHPLWGNALLRQGLAQAIDRQEFAGGLPDSFRLAEVLIPDAVQVLGTPYREQAFSRSPLPYDSVEAERLFRMGLELLDLNQLPNSATIHVPEQAKLSLGIDQLQQSWQKHLSAYLNFEVGTPQQIQTMLRSGDYQLLLLPITPADANIDTLLGVFMSESEQNYFGYRDIRYDKLLEVASEQHRLQEAVARYSQAETMLLSDAVVIPLYFETSYIAIAKDVQGVQISPFGDQIYFKYAQKDG